MGQADPGAAHARRVTQVVPVSGRRVRVRLAGFDAWIATREDLVLSKLVWAEPSGSELQLRDVRAPLAGGADLGYLRRWAADLGVAGMLEKCLDERHHS
jgi:hypothetical protein